MPDAFGLHTEEELKYLQGNGLISAAAAEGTRLARKELQTKYGDAGMSTGLEPSLNMQVQATAPAPEPVAPARPAPESFEFANDFSPAIEPGRVGGFSPSMPPLFSQPAFKESTPIVQPITQLPDQKTQLTQSNVTEDKPRPAVNAFKLGKDAPGGDMGSAPMMGTTTEVTTQTRSIPNQAELNQSVEKLKAAEADVINAQAAQAKIISKRALEAVADDQDVLADIESQRVINKGKLDAEWAKVQDAINEHANHKLDSGRWFANQNAFGKVAAVFGLIAGGLGQAMGAENTALKIITDAVDRDIRLQEHELSQKKSTIDVRNTVYSQMRQQFNDEVEARLATRAATYQMVSRELEALKMRMPDEQTKAAIAKVQAKADAEHQQNMAQLLGTVTTTRINTAPLPDKGSKLTPEVAAKMSAYETDIKSLDDLADRYGKLDVDGWKKFAFTINEGLRFFGVDDSALTKEQVAIKQRSFAAAKAAFGTLSDQQARIAIETFAQAGDSPETFRNLLKDQADLLREKYAAEHQYNTFGGMKLPPIGSVYPGAALTPRTQDIGLRKVP